MDKSYKYILNGILALIFGLMGLVGLLSYHTFSFSIYLWISIVGIHIIIGGYFTTLGYNNRTYFLITFILMGFLGLISVNILLFDHPKNYVITYLVIGLYILFLIFNIRDYIHRNERILPYKDKW